MSNLAILQEFPADFVFGVSTSSYQIEGSKFGGCGSSHWDDYAKQEGRVHKGHDGAVACNHHQHWQQDLDLVKDGGFTAYRFSFSWPRLLPDATGKVNPKGVNFYSRLLDGILERGLQPFATLYHWDLPSRHADAGGWHNRDTTGRFADYTDCVMKNFGDRLATATIAPVNEPWCVSWLSHYLGMHAPGLKDIAATAKAMHYILLAHGKSLEVLRGHSHNNLGAVLNKEYAQPVDDSDLAREKAHLYDGIYNRWFEDAIFKGKYPEEVLAILAPHMPEGYADDLPLINSPLDWIGTNYYTRAIIEPDDSVPHLGFKSKPGTLPKTDMDWEIYPKGLSFFLRRLAKDYAPGLPQYVTENGMANPDIVNNGEIADDTRVDYYSQHLDEVRVALNDGVPLRGYFAWSLMDNFEWSHGYDKRFGIVHVDYKTQVRTPKQSWHAWKAGLQR